MSAMVVCDECGATRDVSPLIDGVLLGWLHIEWYRGESYDVCGAECAAACVEALGQERADLVRECGDPLVDA